jgi:hypothetical protein
VELPTATTIGDEAFKGCTSLINVNFPNVVTIGTSSFQGCISLNDMNFPNVVTISEKSFENCQSLKEINISSATSIGLHAFKNCKGIESIVFGNNIKIIDMGAFHNNLNLSMVGFPGEVENIGHHAFKDCTALEAVVVLNGNTNISAEAFKNTSSLRHIYMHVNTVQLSSFEDSKLTNPNGCNKIIEADTKYNILHCASTTSTDWTNDVMAGTLPALPEDNEDNEDNETSTNIGMIAGIVGGLVLFGVLGVFLFKKTDGFKYKSVVDGSILKYGNF